MKGKFLIVLFIALTTGLLSGCRPGFIERNRPEKILQDGAWRPYYTKHFDFYYRPGSKSDSTIKMIANRQENNYLEVLNRMYLNDHNFRAIFFIFSSFQEYDDITDAGQFGNGHEIGIFDAIYAVDGYSLSNIFGKHELTHFIVDKFFGLGARGPYKWIISEGLAVWMEDNWDGMDLFEFARLKLTEGNISTPYEIVRNDETGNVLKNSYPMAGAFAKYMISNYGIAKYIRLYQQGNSLDVFDQVYGMSLADMSNRFLGFLTSENPELKVGRIGEN
ncbi:MAG: hypothetical protein HF314_11770 [Ignavibacteria bacterium]|jgi:hypothetical protein|nr:hypothetical protein [Ignavibacteria bacterium]MCU7503748.1 hypothetical protein [Ignavibacteria bacterium]MCU7517238.1 hypothetical protein [Ignavibacteria bacterium]